MRFLRALVPCIVAAFWLAPSAANADPPNVAFDQAQRVYVGTEPPPPGTFDGLRSTFELLGPSVEFPPLPGGLPASTGGANGILGGLQRMREGVVYHYSFLGSLERVDDVPSQRATIGRPDADEVDYLDLKAKTVRIVRGEAARNLLAPDLASQVKDVTAQMPAAGAASGTIAFKIDASNRAIPAMTFDGIAGDGLAVTMMLTTTAHSDNCPAVSVGLDSTIYVDPAREERVKRADANDDPRDVLREMQAGRGCVVTFAGDIPKRDPATTRFYLYNASRLTLTIPALPAPIAVVTVVERGHIAPLTSADAGLFEVPADFSPAPEPSPSPAAAATPAPATK